MKKSLNVLFGMSALALLVVAAPAMAGEVDVTAENATTGADSNNDNTFDIDNSGDTDVNNDASVTNSAVGTANTGGNEQVKNTEGGSADTGSVDASTDWETVVNEAAGFGMSAASGDVDGDFTNDTTGADSKNVNLLDLDNKGDLTLNNMAGILNSLMLTANTGDNLQKKNTTAGDIDTGDVDVDSSVTNEANNDSSLASSAAYGDVDVTAENHMTGADSKNENTFEIENKGKRTLNNNASVTNSTVVTANTGGNTQKKNTTAGDIDTGSVDVVTDVTTEVNNGSSLAGASDHGDITGDFTNDTTGADSKNENTLDVDNSGDTEVNNNASVDNSQVVTANTGGNDQEKNTEGGDVSTGDVSIDFSSSTEANNS